ncbi:MAG: DUF4912 domain-containing protein [Elusimicrobiales bacterium]
MPSSGVIADKNIQPDSESAALPQEYGVTMAALMPRDPNWMFVYWQITPNSKARLAREHGPDLFEKGRQAWRVHDLALPDGAVDLPIEAMSKDETEARRIGIKVARSTALSDRDRSGNGLRQVGSK